MEHLADTGESADNLRIVISLPFNYEKTNRTWSKSRGKGSKIYGTHFRTKLWVEWLLSCYSLKGLKYLFRWTAMVSRHLRGWWGCTRTAWTSGATSWRCSKPHASASWRTMTCSPELYPWVSLDKGTSWNKIGSLILLCLSYASEKPRLGWVS